jgi:ribonuclease HII
MDFQQAEAACQSWREEFEGAVNGGFSGEGFVAACSTDMSSMGRWLGSADGQKAPREARESLMDRVQKYHAAAMEIAALAEQSRIDEARAMLAAGSAYANAARLLKVAVIAMRVALKKSH